MIDTIQDECAVEPAEKLERLNAVLAQAWRQNAFYRDKWRRAGLDEQRLEALAELNDYPFTTRADLIADQSAHPPLGANLSRPPAEFKRFMHSSGTTCSPILWADTPRTWDWVTQCSAELHTITGIQPHDMLLFIACIGSASGPWVILEGARRLGCTCLTCGSRDVNDAHYWLKSMRPNVLVGKPEPLLMFAMTVRAHGTNPALTGIERIIMTGQGSSIGSGARVELERTWDAPAFDRYGMTEAGSVAAECASHNGALHLLDREFIAEVIDPMTLAPVDDGHIGELVLTNLGRGDRPIIRYRTGDRAWILRNHQCSCGRVGTVIPRGIQGRLR
jgi:phenylacetate-CoA ligase